MPKIKARKKRRAKAAVRGSQSSRPLTVVRTGAQPATPVAAAASGRRVLPAQSSQGLQSLVMSALVALGCWAFSYYTFLFYRDTNSYLFAGMAALLALVWSISFFVRLRKWRRR
jgi:hypothetical protein